LRTVIINDALEKTLSRERLSKYLDATSQNLDAAIGLYETNTKISEAFYTPLQSLEICFRNSVHAHLANAYGVDWFRNGNPPLQDDSKRMIFDAIEELRRDRRRTDPGDVVAELKFAFWVGLMGPKYDATIWRKCIYKAFLAGGGKPRSTVHGRFNAIRRFRNRVAHHEPIFHKQLIGVHDEIIEAIRWMCKSTAAWSAHHSRVPEVVAKNGLC
jgi:hypothetical protein